MSLTTTIAEVFSALRQYAGRFLWRRLDRGPISTPAQLTEFIHTRSAYVSQTTLYGYLKTRMGKRYVEMFQNDTYADSIDKAKWPIYASCMADLTIFACALVDREAAIDPDQVTALALECYENAVTQTFVGPAAESIRDEWLEQFRKRAALTDWSASAEGEVAFQRSPQDLVTYAPVVDTLKELDAEIVKNSMRFRWGSIREELRRRLATDEIAANWLHRHQAGAGH